MNKNISPMEMAMANLESAYGMQHPQYSRECHKDEVGCGDTRLHSYWEWVVHQIEADGRTVEEDLAGSPFFGKRIEALFQPQQWVGDNALPAGEATSIDVTGKVLQMEIEIIRALADDDYDSDELVNLDDFNHTGPFYVAVADQICDFFGVGSLDELSEESLSKAREWWSRQTKTVQDTDVASSMPPVPTPVVVHLPSAFGHGEYELFAMAPAGMESEQARLCVNDEIGRANQEDLDNRNGGCNDGLPVETFLKTELTKKGFVFFTPVQTHCWDE